jgi:type VI secretion system protein ImpB
LHIKTAAEPSRKGKVMASINDKLERVRKPRVHIKYEIETGGAQVERELPFVVGVMGDFSGNPLNPLPPLKERRFVQIDRDNFNEVLARIAPELNIRVKNTLKDDGTDLAVQLKFQSMDDFEPGNIAQNVPALKKLLETRNLLRDLMTKVDNSDKLENLLERVLKDEDELKRLSSELGIKPEGKESWRRRRVPRAAVRPRPPRPPACSTRRSGQPNRPSPSRRSC